MPVVQKEMTPANLRVAGVGQPTAAELRPAAPGPKPAPVFSQIRASKSKVMRLLRAKGIDLPDYAAAADLERMLAVYSDCYFLQGGTEGLEGVLENNQKARWSRNAKPAPPNKNDGTVSTYMGLLGTIKEPHKRKKQEEVIADMAKVASGKA
jgi:hypothetical protein